MKFYFPILLLFISSLSSATAQDYYIKGQVKDEAGNLLQKVSILHSRSGYLFYSGTSGLFGIISNQKTDTLVFSLDGYQQQKQIVDAWNFTTITLKRSSTNKNTREYKLASLTKNLKREAQRQWFTGEETYASVVENQFVNTTQYSTTGIALNVDRASYSNIRRFLNMNSYVPPDAVRIEELLNYFNFNYKEPKNNKTFETETIFTNCPWSKDNQLLFVNIRSRKIQLDSLPPSHLVFLIDVSGSMDMPNRLPLLKAGFRSLVNNLREKDSVSIVVYGAMVGVMLNATSGAEKEKIFKIIDALTPGGSTPGESGLKLAYLIANQHFIKNGNNRVILATDGDFNVGVKTEEELEELILSQQRSGIYLTCLGVGMGNYKDSKIQTLAQKGNGNFAYIDNFAEADKVLLKEFTQTVYTVADNVFLNVAFDPEYVKEYRLIGFDNKAEAIKDTSSTIEGGVIGPAYSINIAFEIVPTTLNLNTISTKKLLTPVKFLLNYKNPNDSKKSELTENPGILFTSFAALDNNYQFASAIIMFGSLLRNSKYMKHVQWNEIAELATEAADKNNFLQQEFITLVQQAKLIYAKKRKKRN
ncbi:MAG: von Willebrand factor type A domain-containing protein [Chitinophagaceae bacterium]